MAKHRRKARRSRARRGPTAQQKKFSRVARECMAKDAPSGSIGTAMRAYGKCVRKAWRR